MWLTLALARQVDCSCMFGSFRNKQARDPEEERVFSLRFHVRLLTSHLPVDFVVIMALLMVLGSLQAIHILVWSPRFQLTMAG